MSNKRVTLEDYVKTNVVKGDAKGVIKALDRVSNKVEVGILDEKKGSLLETAVQKFNPLVALELGSSCGYAAIIIALEMTKPGSKLLALELNAGRCRAVRSVIDHAGLSDKVKMLDAKANSGQPILNGGLVDELKNFLRQTGAPHFDFIFMNHSKSSYLPDFQVLEDKGMIGKGTGIVANTTDSSGKPHSGVQSYMKHLKDHPEELETETYNSGQATITVSTYIVD